MIKDQRLRRKVYIFLLALIVSATPAQAQRANPPPPQAVNPYTLVPPVDRTEKIPNPLTLPGPPPVINVIDVRTTKEIGGPFSLIDQDGRAVTEKDYEKYYKLIYFGYTNCPSECPMALTKISQVLTKLGPDAEKIRVLFITTDPGRDTPDIMKKYLAKFKSDKIVGLTGTFEDIRKTENEFRIYAEVVNDPRMPSYTVNHSTIIYFTGYGKELLDFMNTSDLPAVMVSLIRQHLRAAKPAKP
ncbi:MAG TPA: SCO family protein [Patescibacteria group bacterium]|nr:SCO family protein [Patescibacteria group bacterium]